MGLFPPASNIRPSVIRTHRQLQAHVLPPASDTCDLTSPLRMQVNTERSALKPGRNRVNKVSFNYTTEQQRATNNTLTGPSRLHLHHVTSCTPAPSLHILTPLHLLPVLTNSHTWHLKPPRSTSSSGRSRKSRETNRRESELRPRCRVTAHIWNKQEVADHQDHTSARGSGFHFDSLRPLPVHSNR